MIKVEPSDAAQAEGAVDGRSVHVHVSVACGWLCVRVDVIGHLGMEIGYASITDCRPVVVNHTIASPPQRAQAARLFADPGTEEDGDHFDACFLAIA